MLRNNADETEQHRQNKSIGKMSWNTTGSIPTKWKCWKLLPKENKNKNWTYNTFHGPPSLEWIDRRYSFPALTYNVNQSNECYKTFGSGLQGNHVTSFHVGCIDKTRNIPDIKQRNILDKRHPSMKSQLWNPQIRSRVGNLLKVYRSHLP